MWARTSKQHNENLNNRINRKSHSNFNNEETDKCTKFLFISITNGYRKNFWTTLKTTKFHFIRYQHCHIGLWTKWHLPECKKITSALAKIWCCSEGDRKLHFLSLLYSSRKGIFVFRQQRKTNELNTSAQFIKAENSICTDILKHRHKTKNYVLKFKKSYQEK